VAKSLKICTTLLKKICRRHGIQRWPHRQIRSIERSTKALRVALTNATGVERERMLEQIDQLEQRRQWVVESASSGLRSTEAQMKKKMESETASKPPKIAAAAAMARQQSVGRSPRAMVNHMSHSPQQYHTMRAEPSHVGFAEAGRVFSSNWQSAQATAEPMRDESREAAASYLTQLQQVDRWHPATEASSPGRHQFEARALPAAPAQEQTRIMIPPLRGDIPSLLAAATALSARSVMEPRVQLEPRVRCSPMDVARILN